MFEILNLICRVILKVFKILFYLNHHLCHLIFQTMFLAKFYCVFQTLKKHSFISIICLKRRQTKLLCFTLDQDNLIFIRLFFVIWLTYVPLCIIYEMWRDVVGNKEIILTVYLYNNVTILLYSMNGAVIILNKRYRYSRFISIVFANVVCTATLIDHIVRYKISVNNITMSFKHWSFV